MPLPSTLSGVVWSEHKANRHGPFEAGGALYVVGRNAAATNLAMYKSTDAGLTWAEKDAANAPTIFGFSPYLVSDAIRTPTLIAVGCVKTSSQDLGIARFDPATDTWQTPIAGGPVQISSRHITATSTAFLASRSDGSFVAATQTLFTSMGQSGRRVSYARHSGSVWSSAVEVVTDSSAAVHYDIRAVILGASDRVHFFYTTSANASLHHRSLSSAGVLDTATVVGAASTTANYTVGTPVMNGTQIVVPYANPDLMVARATSGASPTWTTQAVSTAVESVTNDPETALANPGAVAMDGTTVHVLWSTDATQNIYRDNDAGTGTWGTDTRFGAEAGPVNGVNATKVGAGIGVLYDHNGVVTYDVVALGPVGIALSGAAEGTSASAALRIAVAQPLAGSVTATSATAATAIRLSHPLAASATGTSASAGAFAVAGAALSGAVTGTSASAVTTIRLDQPLAGATAGVSLTAATRLVMDRPLAGSVAGTSVTTATVITVAHSLAGSVTATSATTATRVTITPALSGASTGTSATAATRIVITPSLAGATVATSATAGTAITVGHVLSGAVSGTSATVGAFTALGATLTGAVTGTSASAATRLTISHPIAGAVTGTSATAGVRLVLSHPLSGSVAGTSATTGSFVATGAVLTGAATGTSTTSATRLTLTHPLSGDVVGSSATAAPSVSVAHVLTGAVVATSATAATRIVVTQTLSGGAAGTSATTGAFIGLAVTLTGTSVGTSATNAARITLDQPLAASASGTSILSAPRLVLTHPLDGAALGSSVVAAGGVRISHDLIGGVAGSSVTSADLLFTILARRTFLAPHTVATFTAGRSGPSFVAVRPVRSFAAADTTTGTMVAARSPRTFDSKGPS